MVRAQSTASVLTPICGTWTGNLPAAVGGGQWTWDIPQQGDCSRRPFAGTVSVASTNTLKLGRDSFTGTTIINPDGARVYRGIRRSQCVPVDAEVLFQPGGDTLTLLNVNLQGTTCSGTVAQTFIQLHR